MSINLMGVPTHLINRLKFRATHLVPPTPFPRSVLDFTHFLGRLKTVASFDQSTRESQAASSEAQCRGAAPGHLPSVPAGGSGASRFWSVRGES